jgi:hypothetical protein
MTVYVFGAEMRAQASQRKFSGGKEMWYPESHTESIVEIQAGKHNGEGKVRDALESYCMPNGVYFLFCGSTLGVGTRLR